ncbi:MAG: glycosyltransferase family 2 protein [Longimicrobiaceae bacterium]
MPQTPGRPLVTVVIPTWNRLPLLREAVASVVAQTWPAWELVIVDDGSTDGTAAWVRSLGDPRIRVVELSRCGHVGRLRNAGVRAGSGELVAFLDSDDAWLPQKLEAQVAALRAAGARWCYGRYEVMDAGGRPAPRRAGEFRALSGPIARDLLADRADVFIGTLLLERSLYDEAGGFSEDPRVRRREDWELHVRLAMRADALALDQTLARVRDHGSRTTAGMAETCTLTVATYDAFLGTNPPPELARLARRGRAVHLADAGAEQLARGAWARAAGMFARALLGGVPPGRWARAVVRGARARRRRGNGVAGGPAAG